MATDIEPTDIDEVQLVSAVARITKPPHLVIDLKAQVEETLGICACCSNKEDETSGKSDGGK